MDLKKPMNPQNAPQGQWQQGMQAPYPGQQPLTGQYQGQQYGQYPGQQPWQQGMPVSYAAPRVGFIDAIKTCWIKKFFTFSGRASRSELLFFILSTFVLVALVEVVPPLRALFPFREKLLFVLCLIPSFAVQTRRLHDRNMSGWWQIVLLPFYLLSVFGVKPTDELILILAIPAFIALVIQFIMFFLRGKDAPNRFDEGRAPLPQQFAQMQPYPQQYPAYGAAPAQGTSYPGQQPMPQPWQQGAMPPQGMQPIPPAAPQPAQQLPAQSPSQPQ